MRENPSISELQRLLPPVAVVRPSISQDAKMLLGGSARTVEQVGLPLRQADWFQAEATIEMSHEVADAGFTVNNDTGEIASLIRIGRNEFGTFVLDNTTRHVLYVDESGETQLINTSLERFLYFIGRFRQSANEGFEDLLTLKADFKDTDPAALANPDGFWSLNIEEAEAGLY